MDLAFLSASFHRARAHARDWTNSALNLAFPWQDSAEAAPIPVVPPFCRQCGEPFPGLEHVDSTIMCERCTKQRWHFGWARAAYRTQGQVLEAVLGFKYYDQGREKFQGTKKHGVWLDEEPPASVYDECPVQLMTTSGLMICTFRPLKGLSEIALRFLPDLAPVLEPRYFQ